ncbi:Pre-mRNA-splicing factor cwc26 [Euphorbia peplus]|nr:Pre-mRNA-splicing factor cwc26 [Euphorbia peplus]
MQGTNSLKEYLKRYESNNEEEKKKKRKKKVKPQGPGVLVVDEDPVWQKPVKLDDEEDDDSADEEKPQVNEDIEVKRMKRLEQLRARRHYNAIAEDGSGWVPLSPKRATTDQHSDMSSPHRQRTQNDAPSSSPEGGPLDAGKDVEDLSPPRQRRRRHYTPSPERDSNIEPSGDLHADLSPPRIRRARDDTPDRFMKSTGDLSPPRKGRTDTGKSAGSPDLSPPRKSRANVGKSAGSPDLSPPRKGRIDVGKPAGSQDFSPPRKTRTDFGKPGSKASLNERPKTGLVTGHDIQEEISKSKKNEFLRFEQMDPSMSGRGAEAVFRDKTGQRISKEEYLKLKNRVEEKPKYKKIEWGKGLAQKREAEAKMQELEVEKDKPFARTRDDPELDSLLKDRLRWGDPMAHLVKKKHPGLVLTDLGDSEKMKESGFVVPQEIPNHSWITRRMDAAPNRYGIRPGRHWDGIDRSNGFEKKMFNRQNEKKATEREAYLWSVSDM